MNKEFLESLYFLLDELPSSICVIDQIDLINKITGQDLTFKPVKLRIENNIVDALEIKGDRSVLQRFIKNTGIKPYNYIKYRSRL